MIRSAMTAEQFDRLVSEALVTIPERFRDAMRNIAIVAVDTPSAEVLDGLGIVPPDSLFGLYEGVPLPERDWPYGNALPDCISLFRLPIEAACETDDDIIVMIAETLIHEVGHYFGLSEEEIEQIEERHWRRE